MVPFFSFYNMVRLLWESWVHLTHKKITKSPKIIWTDVPLGSQFAIKMYWVGMSQIRRNQEVKFSLKKIWRSEAMGLHGPLQSIPWLNQNGAAVIFIAIWWTSNLCFLLGPPERLTAPWVCSGPALCAPTWACSSPGSWPVSLVSRSSLPPPRRHSFNQVNICAAESHQCHSHGPADGTDTGCRAAVTARRTKHGDRLVAVCSRRVQTDSDMCHQIWVTDRTCCGLSVLSSTHQPEREGGWMNVDVAQYVIQGLAEMFWKCLTRGANKQIQVSLFSSHGR